VFMEFILQINCADRPGILDAATRSIANCGGDIRDAVSFGDPGTGRFFTRIHLRLSEGKLIQGIEQDMQALEAETSLWWRLHSLEKKQRVMILLSKFDHCLNDILHRWKLGEMDMVIPLVVSNHETSKELLDWYKIPFHHLPITPDTKELQEKQLVELIEKNDIDLVVLARYMQVLSPQMCEYLQGRCINIHHSFLPGFKGANPYKRAHKRGVKLIGATAHYVTDDLDEGPIIEQEVMRVTHAVDIREMTAIGRGTEAAVLSRAVRWHVERRIMMNGSKTVVFS